MAAAAYLAFPYPTNLPISLILAWPKRIPNIAALLRHKAKPTHLLLTTRIWNHQPREPRRVRKELPTQYRLSRKKKYRGPHLDDQEGSSVLPAASGNSSPIESSRQQQQHYDHLLATADMFRPITTMNPVPHTNAGGDNDGEMFFLDEPDLENYEPETHPKTDEPASNAVATPIHVQPAAVLFTTTSGSISI